MPKGRITLIFICLLALLPFARAQQAAPPIRENRVVHMPGQVYAAVVHAQPRFESSETIVEGARALIDFARSRGIPSLAVVNNTAERYYRYQANGTYLDERFIWLDNASRYIESHAGQHRLNFPNARDFILGGGQLSWCLCEFLRDTIRGARPTQGRTLRLVLVTDAIYDSQEFGAMNMQRFIEQNGNSAIQRVLLEKVLGNNKHEICHQQNFYGFPNLFARNYNFRFLVGDDVIGGTEIRPNRPQIDIVMLPSSALSAMFPAQISPPEQAISREAIGR
jgi:hypothetical protein